MGNSACYLTIRTMLQDGSLIMSYSDLVKTLELLASENLITADEHQELLELAQEIKLLNIKRKLQ